MRTCLECFAAVAYVAKSCPRCGGGSFRVAVTFASPNEALPQAMWEDAPAWPVGDIAAPTVQDEPSAPDAPMWANIVVPFIGSAQVQKTGAIVDVVFVEDAHDAAAEPEAPASAIDGDDGGTVDASSAIVFEALPVEPEAIEMPPAPAVAEPVAIEEAPPVPPAVEPANVAPLLSNPPQLSRREQRRRQGR